MYTYTEEDRAFVKALSEAQVAEGTRNLDAWNPDWRNRINTETFRIRSCASCIFGQLEEKSLIDYMRRTLYAGSWYGTNYPAEWGFSADSTAVGQHFPDAYLPREQNHPAWGNQHDPIQLAYDFLQEAWLTEISKRKESTSPTIPAISI